MKKIFLVLISVFALTSCTTVLKPRVRHSGKKEPRRVLVLPATCTALSGSCSKEDTAAIEAMIVSELEFGGLEVVSARRLNAEKRSRAENQGQLSVLGIEMLSASSLAQVGSLFEDMPPAEQKKLLQAVGASGVVYISLQRRVSDAVGPRHVVNIRLRGGKDLSQIWVTECSALSGLANPGYAEATESATKCALAGVYEHVENKPARCATAFCSGD